MGARPPRRELRALRRRRQTSGSALNDGRTITTDAYTITYEEITVVADPAAERPLGAEWWGA